MTTQTAMNRLALIGREYIVQYLLMDGIKDANWYWCSIECINFLRGIPDEERTNVEASQLNRLIKIADAYEEVYFQYGN